jgi:hypothetical protein
MNRQSRLRQCSRYHHAKLPIVISPPYQRRISSPVKMTPPYNIILVIAPTFSERIGASWGGAERNAAKRIAVVFPARDGA